jgi:large subunit ribosomal protein L11
MIDLAENKVIESLINGGQATAGPPLGPALGPLGVNVLSIVNKINELTSSFEGMKVPVKIIVDVETKEFRVEVGTPTTSALIVKNSGIKKGSGNPGSENIGNLTIDQVFEIAEAAKSKLLSRNPINRIKEILGTCQSMGITIDNKSAKIVLEEIKDGKYDNSFKKNQ